MKKEKQLISYLVTNMSARDQVKCAGKITWWVYYIKHIPQFELIDGMRVPTGNIPLVATVRGFNDRRQADVLARKLNEGADIYDLIRDDLESGSLVEVGTTSERGR